LHRSTASDKADWPAGEASTKPNDTRAIRIEKQLPLEKRPDNELSQNRMREIVDIINGATLNI
jgi:hypothetical protein